MMLEKLNFKCYNNCTKIIPYMDIIKHENECTESHVLCEECGQSRKRHKFKYQIENKIKLAQKEILEINEKIEIIEKENQEMKEENIIMKASLKKFESNKSIDDDSNVFLQDSYDTNKSKTFEYNIFRTSCHHYRYHNFVCIFSCCNKAFPCFICHDNESDHTYTEVEKGYCSKCLSIFTWERTYYCPNCGQFKQKTENFFVEFYS
jgi:hypothetical protein